MRVCPIINGMMRTAFKLLLLNFCLITSSYATTLGLGPGQLKLTTGSDKVCTPGPFKIVGEQGEEVLMVGTLITFSLPSEKKEILNEASEAECAEDVLSTLKSGTLTNVTSTHSCPPRLKHLERTVTESLTVKEKTLSYKKISGKDPRIECIFLWSAHEKK